MNNCLNDYTHKITRWLTAYSVENNINTVIFGDIKRIRDNFDKGNVLNQRMHSWPFKRILEKLRYKLALEGVFVNIKMEKIIFRIPEFYRNSIAS